MQECKLVDSVTSKAVDAWQRIGLSEFIQFDLQQKLTRSQPPGRGFVLVRTRSGSLFNKRYTPVVRSLASEFDPARAVVSLNKSVAIHFDTDTSGSGKNVNVCR